MLELLVSELAEADFYDIAAFGSERYGALAAADYVDSFWETFNLLCRHPELGRGRPELDAALRSHRHESHIIYYVVQADAVLIVRVLHGAADVAKAFKK